MYPSPGQTLEHANSKAHGNFPRGSIHQQSLFHKVKPIYRSASRKQAWNLAFFMEVMVWRELHPPSAFLGQNDAGGTEFNEILYVFSDKGT
jgi:hypothetical protein